MMALPRVGGPLAARAESAVFVVNAPSYLSRTWQSLILQFDSVRHGVRIASVVDVLSGAVGIVTLLFPVAGITLLCLLSCRRAGADPRP
jgi:hypothetical protein